MDAHNIERGTSEEMTSEKGETRADRGIRDKLKRSICDDNLVQQPNKKSKLEDSFLHSDCHTPDPTPNLDLDSHTDPIPNLDPDSQTHHPDPTPNLDPDSHTPHPDPTPNLDPVCHTPHPDPIPNLDPNSHIPHPDPIPNPNDPFFDPDCTECNIHRPDPTPNDFIMYLHALKYSGHDWEYSTEYPEWAHKDWKYNE